MSFYYVKGITIKNDSVSFTIADSSIRPLYFHKVGSDQLSEMLKTEGKQAVLANIGEDIWDGNFHLYKGTKLCNLFLEAKSALPSGLHWSNFDSKAAGEFLATAVMKLEQDRRADLSEDINKLLALRNNKEHILDVAHRSGKNLLNFASEELQNDKEFALEVIRAGAGCAWFDYPKAFAKDKEVALEALKLNGCYYRELDASLKADKKIILEAFADRDGRQAHEHLPDLIPSWVFTSKIYLMDVLDRANNLKVGQDTQFMFENWSWTLKREGQMYKPFLYFLEGTKLNDKGEPTGERWARRYHDAEKALLHICNKLNENINFPNKFNSLEDAFKSKSVLDREFACRLISCCPGIHIHRASWLLEDRDVALKWCSVGKWIPNDVTNLPKRYAADKEFQDILLSRCNTDKAHTILKEKFAEMGVELYTEKKPSLSSQLQSAGMRSSAQHGNNISPEQEHSI